MPSHDDYTEAYAECYEFITQHKNYAEEVDMLIDFLEKHEFDRKILSVGCGTGMHEFQLAKRGFRVFGIDKSEWMINLALSKSNDVPNLSFGQTYLDAEQYLGAPFRCVISLFNVVNCLPDLFSLREFFQEIFARMETGGIFFFEAWNGTECLINPPQTVVRNFESSSGSSLARKALPCLKTSRQHLELRYEIDGYMLDRAVSVKSLHNIRLFTVNEMIYLLSSVGFKSVRVFSSLPGIESFDFDSLNPPRMLSFSALT